MTLKQKITSRPWVLAVDYDDGGTWIVTLKPGWDFADDPGCGVAGFDTLREAAANTTAADVEKC